VAPLPQNNTGRVFLDYNTCGEDHTMAVRFQSASTPGAALTVIDQLLTALDAGLTLLTVTGCRVQNAGDNFSLPLTWTGASTYGGSPGPHYKTAAYLDFVGRGLTGRKVRIAVFGPGDFVDTANEDFRFTAADSAVISDALDVLFASGGVVCDIDDQEVLWQLYANTGFNAYWRNRIR
jgi:hypothetical protein